MIIYVVNLNVIYLVSDNDKSPGGGSCRWWRWLLHLEILQEEEDNEGAGCMITYDDCDDDDDAY